MPKKPMTIEAALRWAIREELPKREQTGGAIRSAWDSLGSFAELLTRIDYNHHGVLPDPSAFGEPHPDALALSAAVHALNGMELGVPDGWSPIADWGELGDLGRAAVARALDRETVTDATGARLFKIAPSNLVIHFAVMGDREEWVGDRPEIKPVLENGKPKWFRMERRWVDSGRHADQKLGHWVDVEVSGSDKKRRPLPGAYRKHFLDPDPFETIIARMEWEVWRDCLDVLIETVGELQSIALQPSVLTRRPWEDGVAQPRMLKVEGARPFEPSPPARAPAPRRNKAASAVRFPMREKIASAPLTRGSPLT